MQPCLFRPGEQLREEDQMLGARGMNKLPLETRLQN
jgi:hypothetical protein